MRKPQPSNLEMTILSLLWDQGGLTARQVLESMPDKKKRAYTSILSALQVMEKKGFVKHTAQGVAHVYTATVSKHEVLRPMFKDMVTNLFGGSAVSAMQQFLDAAPVGDEELAELDQLISAYRKNTENRTAERGDSCS